MGNHYQDIAVIDSLDIEEYLDLDSREELFNHIYNNGLMDQIIDLAADELSDWFYAHNEVITRKIYDVARHLVGDEFDELYGMGEGRAVVIPGQIDLDGNEVRR